MSGASSFMPQDIRNTKRWQRLRHHVTSDQPWCALCGRETDLTVDHITPLAHGGDPWDPENLRVLCRPCNSRKGQRERRFLRRGATPRPQCLVSLPAAGEPRVSRVW